MSSELIMGLGSDQMANQFSVEFPAGIPGGGNARIISLRSDESFPMPDESVATYDVNYRGAKYTIPGTMEETDKTITFNVRLDQQWEVYDDLKTWKNMVWDPENHLGLEVQETRTIMVVHTYGRNKEIARTFTFKGVALNKIKVTDFDHGSTDPSKIELGFTYFVMLD